jgi:hypothetical protein
VLSQIEKRIVFKKRRSLRVVAEQINLSKSSIQRATKKLGLVAYHQSWAPRLTLKHLADRKKFARAHKNFDWSKVLFIDEKIAFLIPKPNSKNDVIWAPKGSVIPNLPRDVHPVKWNVSAGISISGRSEIYIFDQNMNGQLFKEILASTLLPAGKKTARKRLVSLHGPRSKAHIEIGDRLFAGKSYQVPADPGEFSRLECSRKRVELVG